MTEALAQTHGGGSRKNHQAGDQQRTHQHHAKHHGYGCQHGDQQIIKADIQPRCPCEVFIEGYGKDLIVKEDIHQQHADA